MNLTIIVEDNTVVIDGKAYTIDCSALAGIHAVTWNGTAGSIEYPLIEGVKQPNAAIDDVAPYQTYIDAWNAIDSYVPPPPPPPTLTDLIVYANRRQWQKVISGYPTTVDGVAIVFPTSTESLSLINGKFARLQQPNPPTSIAWQVGATTFIDISVADFTTIAVEIADFVQATFDKLRNEVLPAIVGGTITTLAQIDAAFS